MGNKINPNFYRLSLKKNWEAKWIALKNFYIYLINDIQIRNIINTFINKNNIINTIFVEQFKNIIIIHIFSIKPGIIIGKLGKNIKKLKSLIETKIKKNIYININEPQKIEALIQHFILKLNIKINNNIKYISLIKILNKLLFKKYKIKGLKIEIAGRIFGNDIARIEKYKIGKMPLNTISSNIFYIYKNIKTKHGLLGLKIWIHK